MIEKLWIPVSERLPSKHNKYLVTVKPMHGFSRVEKCFFGVEEGNIFWQGKYGRSNFQDITKDVVAWMPLPEPYEGK